MGESGAPVSASQASTDSPWWSSPQATTSPGASASSSAIASTTACRTSSPSCSTQPGCGWRFDLSRRASRTGRRRSSNSAALTPVVPSSMPRISGAMRASSTTAPRGAGTSPGGSDRSAPSATPARSTSAATCSPIPSDADSPVERMAATLMSCGHAGEGPIT